MTILDLLPKVFLSTTGVRNNQEVNHMAHLHPNLEHQRIYTFDDSQHSDCAPHPHCHRHYQGENEHYIDRRTDDFKHTDIFSNRYFFIRNGKRFSSPDSEANIIHFFNKAAQIDLEGRGGENTEFINAIYQICDAMNEEPSDFSIVIGNFTPQAITTVTNIKKYHAESNFSHPCHHNNFTTCSYLGGQRHQTTQLIKVIPPAQTVQPFQPVQPVQESTTSPQQQPYITPTQQTATATQKPTPKPRSIHYVSTCIAGGKLTKRY